MDFDADKRSRTSPLARLHTIKLPLWVSVMLLLVALGFFVAWQLTARQADRRVDAERAALEQQAAAAQATVEAESRQMLMRHSEDAHMLFGTALAWAVRSALMRNNLDEIDQYFAALVRNQRVQLVLVADQAGKVLVASDRQLQGSQLEKHFPATLLEIDKVTIQREGEKNRLILPIQGLTSRIGTGVVVYATP